MEDPEESKNLLMVVLHSVEEITSKVTEFVNDGGSMSLRLKSSLKEYMYVVEEIGETWETLGFVI